MKARESYITYLTMMIEKSNSDLLKLSELLSISKHQCIKEMGRYGLLKLFLNIKDGK